MKSLTMLSLALPVALFATACNHTADDMSAAEPAAAPAAESMAPEPVTPAPAPTMPEPAAPPMGSDMTFGEMDKNADGGITQDELAPTDMLHQHFSAADTDGDGSLSSAEVDAHHAAMAAPPAN